MRMSPDVCTTTAAEVINTYNETDLIRILRTYGDERHASRIAREIVRRRAKQPIQTTFELVDVVKAAIPAADRRHGHHPARKTFQALRIEVNHELEVLERGLRAAVRWLNPGGGSVLLATTRWRIASSNTSSPSSLAAALAHQIFRCACVEMCRHFA